MKKRWLYLLTAVMLAVGVCAAKPVASDAAPLTADEDGYVAEKCSLIVNPEDPRKMESEGSFGEDLEDADVVIDLYQVAKAVKVQGYDAYRYEVVPGYGLTIPESPGTDDWKNLAQEAAEAALRGGASGTITESEIEPGAKTELDAGLYLVIARGSGLEKYVKEISELDEETGEETTKLVTIANSRKYEYQFEPQLISLPTKEAENGVINTANPGEWVINLEINLKPERTPRFGSLEIVKTLSTYETEEGIKEPVTFVFEVIGRLPDKDGKVDENSEVVYSNVDSITFTAAGQESVILSRIPATAVVTVREIYGGSSYELTVPGDRTQTIAADDVVKVDFENTYTWEQKKGHGIKNQFVYDEEENRWHWYSDPKQDADGNEGLPPAVVQ